MRGGSGAGVTGRSVEGREGGSGAGVTGRSVEGREGGREWSWCNREVC